MEMVQQPLKPLTVIDLEVPKELDVAAIRTVIRSYPKRHWKKLEDALRIAKLRDYDHDTTLQYMQIFMPLSPEHHQARYEAYLDQLKAAARKYGRKACDALMFNLRQPKRYQDRSKYAPGGG